jgi:hypothetical protein
MIQVIRFELERIQRLAMRTLFLALALMLVSVSAPGMMIDARAGTTTCGGSAC